MTKVVNRSTKINHIKHSFCVPLLGTPPGRWGFAWLRTEVYSILKNATLSMSQHLQNEGAATIWRSAYFETRAILKKNWQSGLFLRDWLCRGSEMPGLRFWAGLWVPFGCSELLTGIPNVREICILGR